MTALQLDLLAIAENPHPLVERSRAAIRAAIKADALAHGGVVSPNRVRAALSDARGLTVPPRMLSSTYSALASRRVLAHRAWDEVNDDHAGRNAGRPSRTWLLVGEL